MDGKEAGRRKRLPMVGLLVLMLSSSVVAYAASITFNPGVIYHTLLGGGDLSFTMSFTASQAYYSGNYLIFTGMSLFGGLGFYLPAGCDAQITSVTTAKIQLSVTSTVVGVTFGVYTPGKVPVDVTGETTWSNAADVTTVTPTNGVSNVAIIFSADTGGGGTGYVPPEDTPPGVPPISGGLPDWVPPPVQEIIVRIQPWWSRYGAAVIIGCVFSVFILNATKSGKRRRSGLDVVLNPDRALARGSGKRSSGRSKRKKRTLFD